MTSRYGPWVIVNTLSGAAWVRRWAGANYVRREFATKREAVAYRNEALIQSPITIHKLESTIMTLVQYLIEYGDQ